MRARLVPLLLLLGAPLHALSGQGVSTASISGVVMDERGGGLEGSEVRVISRANGVATRSLTHARGRYTVHGLEVGGPYSIVFSLIGFRPAVREGVFLSLGQDLRLDVGLQALPIELPAVEVEGDPTFSLSRTGVESVVSDSLLHRLPTADRDLFAFVQLVPQMLTGYGFSSGGGVNRSFNAILLDGASDQAYFGANPGGAVFGGKPISIEAVKEYQILFSPYDVRYGSFAGALINGVTKGGTNEWRGTAYYYFRNEHLARNVEFLRASPYDRAQFGFTVGGPIVRDRVHVFVAPEWQRLSAPAEGPFLGQSASAQPSVLVSAADVDRFVRILAAHGLEAGSAGAVSNENPLVNLFGRIDVALPRWNSRLVLRHNYSRADTNAFSRPNPESGCRQLRLCFPLSSVGRTNTVIKHSTAVQLYTNLANGVYNELMAGRNSIPLASIPTIRAPLVVVQVPAVQGGTASLQAGSVQPAQGDPRLNGRTLTQEIFEVTDNLTVPIAEHRVTAGVTSQFYRIQIFQVPEKYGVWEFSSLDSLEQNTASSYRVTRDFGGGEAFIKGAQYGVYLGDQWPVNDRLSLTFGLRADVSVVANRPPYDPSVDSVFRRRTDVVPSGQVLWSPRLGFHWNLPGTHVQQLRGGVGLFAGRPPMAWLLRAFQNYGSGLRTLDCRAGGVGLPPPFQAAPDYRNPPLFCANGFSFDSGAPGPVNVVDERLKFPQTLRATLGYDRRLPWGVVATLEALYTQGVHDFLFVNLNLQDTVAVDRHGRVMYGWINPSGVATTNAVSLSHAQRPVAVIGLENQSRNYSYSLTGQLEKRLSDRIYARAAYNHSRARDVQSHLYFSYLQNWELGRVVSGNHLDRRLGVSDFDQPHRVILVATYTAPWRTWNTDVSFYYVGTSGVPYTYTSIAGQPPLRQGDLNADGSNLNDPIYVPRNTNDTSEILFAGTPAEVVTQQAALARFIAGSDCLRTQRGRIMARNSCRTPWVHSLNVSVRQGLPTPWGGGDALSVQLEVFNFLNLLNKRWGQVQLPTDPFVAQVGLLEHVGQTAGPVSPSEPIFTFNSSTPRYTSQNAASNYQIQLAARYSF